MRRKEKKYTIETFQEILDALKAQNKIQIIFGICAALILAPICAYLLLSNNTREYGLNITIFIVILYITVFVLILVSINERKKILIRSMNDKKNIDECKEYLIKLVTFLSYDFKRQIDEIGKEYDTLADDVADDWDFLIIKGIIEVLYSNNHISKDIVDKIIVICKNFDEVSAESDNYDEDVWTIEGFKYSLFWNSQRKLAKEILEELENH